ncbi:toprim domain-containing protein [uncultured Capnocytophaga sp.]|uniref:toprim domain-containing protein n=1 Tax=uncultured Capnocytophaga sp. TaxID=159273 RepID=UPI00262C33FE|nr:toprim domain-containing protein [uncultured Capnocytophaga sp.]
MNIGEINEQIKIEDFLANEGFYPDKSKKGGLELWYCSPLRSEHTASFKVHTGKNVWFDYPQKVGGKLVELCRLLKNMDINEVVYYFNNEYKGGATPIIEHYRNSEVEQENDNGDEILNEIKPIENRKLYDYLRSRNVNFDIAKEYLTEVHYLSGGKRYYSLGFRCDNAGYELRNCYSKRNINGKNFSTIKNGSEKVKMFEGFFDFLSYASEHKETYKDYDYIVLNTVAFVQSMYNNLNRETNSSLYKNLLGYNRIDTYFDNDGAGKEITKLMENLFDGVNNFSVLFDKYDDYNDFCIRGRYDGVFTPEENSITPTNTKVRGKDNVEVKEEENVKEEYIKKNIGAYSNFK